MSCVNNSINRVTAKVNVTQTHGKKNHPSIKQVIASSQNP